MIDIDYCQQCFEELEYCEVCDSWYCPECEPMHYDECLDRAEELSE